MGLAQDIQRRIKNKESELATLEKNAVDLQVKIGATKAYIQGLRDILPRAEREAKTTSTDFRAGSAPAKVKALLEKAGKPMHITEIVTGIGKENTKPNRLSLGGTLSRYVREGHGFTRPAPNTFGLPDMQAPDDELPEGFGQ